MKIWAPPLSWLTLVDQEGGGDFFCPSFTDQPVDLTVRNFECLTVKNKSSKCQNFNRVYYEKSVLFGLELKEKATFNVKISCNGLKWLNFDLKQVK